MKKVIKSEALKGITKLIGHKGEKKGGKPLTDELRDKVKKHRVA